MIAGEYAFTIRSLAHARSLFRIHCVWRERAPFSPAHSFVVPSGEDGGDDGVAVLRFVPRPVLRPVFSFRLYVHCSLFIRVVASRMRRRFPSPPFASCLAPSNPPPLCLLPHSLRSSLLIRLVSRPVLRLVSRFVLMPSCRPSRSSSRPVLSDVPNGLPPVLRSRRFVHLILPFSPMPCRPLVASWSDDA